MEYDYTWGSLTKPGESSRYFNLIDPPALTIGAEGFNAANAWWLAEISRLVYHDNFHKDNSITFGCFKYEIVAFIDHQQTSTKAALLKVTGIDKAKNSLPCLVLAFRGTDEIDDWYTNLHAYQVPFADKGHVHAGFSAAYSSIKEELHNHLDNNKHPLFITGHSLGAALATLVTADLYSKDYFDSCYTFGSPRAGNKLFVNSIKTDRVFRIVNNIDIVTLLPLDFAKIQYIHCGEPHIFKLETGYAKGLSDEEIYAFQKQHISDLKEYVRSKIFTSQIKNIKTNVPAFLADHAPINYVVGLANLINDG